MSKKNVNFIGGVRWNYGGWGHGPGQSLGEIPFGSDTGVYFRRNIEAPWLAFWLKDKGKLPLKEAMMFQTGSDTWTAFDAWPPREAKSRNLYFHEDGKLSFESPETTAGEAFDSYESDPAHPVPYRQRPVDMPYPHAHPATRYTSLAQDQPFWHARP